MALFLNKNSWSLGVSFGHLVSPSSQKGPYIFLKEVGTYSRYKFAFMTTGPQPTPLFIFKYILLIIHTEEGRGIES